MSRKRSVNMQGGKVYASNQPTWLAEIGRRELEDLVCESTLGGCGHSFHMHGSTEISPPPGSGAPRTHAWCIACNAEHDKWKHSQGKYAGVLPNGAQWREPRRCNTFVNGLIRHADAEKLFRESTRAQEAAQRKPRFSKEQRADARAAARNIASKLRKENE